MVCHHFQTPGSDASPVEGGGRERTSCAWTPPTTSLANNCCISHIPGEKKVFQRPYLFWHRKRKNQMYSLLFGSALACWPRAEPVCHWPGLFDLRERESGGFCPWRDCHYLETKAEKIRCLDDAERGPGKMFFFRQVLTFFKACKWILTLSTCDDRQDPKYATLKCKQRREWTKYYEGFMRKRLAWDDQAQLLSSEFFECINNFRVH